MTFIQQRHDENLTLQVLNNMFVILYSNSHKSH